jgi:hypothetical protein
MYNPENASFLVLLKILIWKRMFLNSDINSYPYNFFAKKSEITVKIKFNNCEKKKYPTMSYFSSLKK